MRLLVAIATVALVSTAAFADSTMSASKPAMSSHTMMGSGPAKMMGTGTMIIHHEVADYAKWRVAYDADQPNRTSAGLTRCDVQRSIDNTNDVMISCHMADIAKARAFASSTTLMETMSKAGVVGKPQFMFLSPPQ